MLRDESSFARQADFNDDRGTVSGYERNHQYANPQYTRADAAIEEDIWNRILMDRSLGVKYRGNISVDVERGRVKLRGHVIRQWHIPLIVNIASRTEGVVFVRQELVADDMLQEQAVRALLADERTSPYIFTVKSNFGWLQLGGLVPSHETAKAAEGVVGFLSSVRGIISLPSVFGSAWTVIDEVEPVRRALQPRLAATVYQDAEHKNAQHQNGEDKLAAAGLVSQVIIDPCSRLVSAIGVRATPAVEGEEPIERLVPLTAVEAANEHGVWLKDGETIERHPVYDRRKFPLPPPNWRPPFPYLPGAVRWALQSE